ncbi:SCN11A [Symbiodinium natans]|uniref:SCN11A protein n=1 Tax=Symbiodinium natans TaxID=878477 RepID=A0A812HF23_9DINO|nr:SCN11A [Symbiodinium natans]
MDEEAGFGSIRGAARGVYVERPSKPGKVFKLRDVRTSKDWPRASKDMRYGSHDYPRHGSHDHPRYSGYDYPRYGSHEIPRTAPDGRRSRDPSPLPTPGTSPYRSTLDAPTDSRHTPSYG